MRKGLTLTVALVMLSGCASTTSLAVRSATDTEPATRASIIRALGGGLFDNIDGDQAGRADRMLALEAEYRALERTPAGQPVPWRSEGDDLSGEVIAAQPYRVGSQDCRSYSHSVTRGGDTRTARGTACRNSDGSWTPLT